MWPGESEGDTLCGEECLKVDTLGRESLGGCESLDRESLEITH